MGGIPPKQLARIGQFCLTEAVLDVLCQAKREGKPIGPAEVSVRAGLFRSAPGKMNDALAGGTLYLLLEEGKVRKLPDRGGWEITDEEFSRRNDG